MAMNVVGLGTDIVHIPRVARLQRIHGDRFLKKFLHSEEIQQFHSIKAQAKKDTFLAARWAAKEAAYKAFSRWRIPFPDLVVSNNERGAPELKFEGMAKDLAEQLKLEAPLLSMSHDTAYATATVLLRGPSAVPTL